MAMDKLVPNNAQLTEDFIAVIIPSYKATSQIMSVRRRIPEEDWRFYVVDDACPDGSGYLVKREITDGIVMVIFNSENQVVGGAVMAGYRRAMTD